ncbi:MAG: ribonuclease P [archaeon]|nr:ribonuclease P [archaeon]
MKHTKIQQLALERIYRLFELAEKEFQKHPKRSKRYISLAREIGKKATARFPFELKKKYCKKCNSVFTQTNSETKKTGDLTAIKCLECGAQRKFGTKPGPKRKEAF